MGEKNLDVKMFCHKATDREFVWRVKLGEEEMKIRAREKEKRGVSNTTVRLYIYIIFHYCRLTTYYQFYSVYNSFSFLPVTSSHTERHRLV